VEVSNTPPPLQRWFVTAAVTPHRFPPPWTVEELEACFVVKDAGGQKVGYI